MFANNLVSVPSVAQVEGTAEVRHREMFPVAVTGCLQRELVHLLFNKKMRNYGEITIQNPQR